MNPSSWEIFEINLGSSGLVGMDGWALPIWRSKVVVPAKFGTGNVAQLRQKGLGGKNMRVNLILETVPFDANQELEISWKINQKMLFESPSTVNHYIQCKNPRNFIKILHRGCFASCTQVVVQKEEFRAHCHGPRARTPKKRVPTPGSRCNVANSMAWRARTERLDGTAVSSLVTWRRIVTMASQRVEASKVAEVLEERGCRETRGDAWKKRRSKALSPASRDAFTAYERRLAKLELAMGDVHEQLDTLDYQMEEHDDRGGVDDHLRFFQNKLKNQV
ncbi:hypothetical protein SLEP1_g10997 [Rubroshorea leprosula]|uniref:Uncharacterized protein n=1 Tax=Rubroshorea leprosula TaxID=152421 RepID=A0AAV5IHT9_9ROSI|nr:hypothetical protein SLEP1_g10997 [Rubroshorea leprosula]